MLRLIATLLRMRTHNLGPVLFGERGTISCAFSLVPAALRGLFFSLCTLFSALALLFFSPVSVAALMGDTLPSTPNFNYEHELLQQHQMLVERYTSNYDKLQISKQPANKTEQCVVSSELLDGFLDNTSLLFWEGSCQNGKAEGFGRVYVIKRGQKVFEMLTNFHSDEPQFTTTYYSKNTMVNAQTVYFYGKATRYHSSGVIITQRSLNNDLVVAMQTIDKVNFITYQKETSLNSPYVLNIEDFGNHTHFIYDLNDSPYRSLFMAYKLVDNTRGHNIGYSFTGQDNGKLNGTFTNDINNSSNIDIPPEELQHIININEAVEVNIESSIKNVIESLVVVDAYLNVICADTYQNPVCTKMDCKQICNLNVNITPDHQQVKELLLRLADHHNQRPIRNYLEAGIERSGKVPAQNQNADILLQNQQQANMPAQQNTNINVNTGVQSQQSDSAQMDMRAALQQRDGNQRRQAMQAQQQQLEQDIKQEQQQRANELPRFRARETMLRDLPNYQREEEGTDPDSKIILPFDQQTIDALDQEDEYSRRYSDGNLVPQDIISDKDDLTESERQRREEIINRNRPQFHDPAVTPMTP